MKNQILENKINALIEENNFVTKKRSEITADYYKEMTKQAEILSDWHTDNAETLQKIRKIFFEREISIPCGNFSVQTRDTFLTIEVRTQRSKDNFLVIKSMCKANSMVGKCINEKAEDLHLLEELSQTNIANSAVCAIENYLLKLLDEQK